MYPELSDINLSPEQMAVVSRLLSERDAVIERYRSVNRERVRKFRATRAKPGNATPKIGNVTLKTRNVTTDVRNVTTAKSLKVSRNFSNVTPCNVTRGETYKEGGKEGSTSQVLFPTVRVPSMLLPPAAASPPVPEPNPPSTQQARTKTELYAVGVKLLGKRGGGMVSKLLKLYRDEVSRVAKIFSDAERAADPAAWIAKCASNRQKFFDRENVARRQRLEWEPVDGEFPKRDLSHPAQAYYIPAEWDRRHPVYLDEDVVERKVMAQRLQTGRVYG